MEATAVPPVPPQPSPRCPLLAGEDDVDAEGGRFSLEMLDFQGPGPGLHPGLPSLDAPPPPLPPRPSSVDNQCDQQCGPAHAHHGLGQEVAVEVAADPFSVKHRQPRGPEDVAAQIAGPVERDIFCLASGLAVSAAQGQHAVGAGVSELAAPGATSSFRRSPSPPSTSSNSAVAKPGPGSHLVRSDSWKFSDRPPTRGSRDGSQLNQGFEDSDSDASSSRTVTPDFVTSTSSSSPGAAGPQPRHSQRRQRPRQRRPRSTAGEVSSLALTRCRQWASQARRSLRVGRDAAAAKGFTNLGHEDAADAQASAQVGPLPRDSRSFLRPPPPSHPAAASRTRTGSFSAASAASAAPGPPSAAYDRSSLMEPLRPRQWSLDWTAASAIRRPYSVAALRRGSSDTCSSCAADEIDWSWVEEEVLQLQQQQQQPRQQGGAGSADDSPRCSLAGSESPACNPGDSPWPPQPPQPPQQQGPDRSLGQGLSPGAAPAPRPSPRASPRTTPRAPRAAAPSTTLVAGTPLLEPLESPPVPSPRGPTPTTPTSAGPTAMQGAAAAAAAAQAPRAACEAQAGTTNWSYQCDDEEDEPEDEDAADGPGVARCGSQRSARRPSSWLRASMRRVRHFRLGDQDRRSAPPDVSALAAQQAVALPHLPASTAAVLLSESASALHAASTPQPQGARPRSAPAGPTAALTPGGRQHGRAAAAAGRSLAAAAVRPCARSAERLAAPPLVSPVHAEPRTTLSSASSTSSSSSDSSRPATASPSRSTGSSRQRSDTRSCEVMPEGARGASPLGQWPHNLSATLACLGCTVGLFNISRFAVLSVQFGANFIIQFLLLSAVFGIPLYTFQVCLGQFLAAGAVDMWRISPVFQGIGIALLVSQALIGVYSTVGVSWIFIYFRDSFITKQDRYRWAEPFDLYREDQRLYYNNATPRLEQTVPDYLNGVVLQRHNLAQPENSFGHIKFQVAFNLAVVWMIVFVSLSKGLRSYGKVVYVFSVVPVFGMLVLCTKMLGLMPRDSHHQVFPETEWTEFFTNSACWVAATTEAFLTWGLLGTSAMQIASHNKQKKFLQRDSSLVIIFTVSMLLLAAFLANMCVALLYANGLNYVPSSFERMSTYQFLQPYRYQETPVRLMPHASYVMGERVQRSYSSHLTTGGEYAVPNPAQESGYQVLRLATELVPTTLALLGADQVSPFWAVLFYFVLILFGVAQQLAIWHCVITGIMAINAQSLKSWETTITFFSCACGFILGLPMTTELGIFVVYFLDFCVGSGWWLMVLQLLQIGAVLVVRGRPYSGENIASTLFHKTTSCMIAWAAPMLTFTWNVILPVILMVVCITVFKKGGSRELYSWHVSLGYDYWPLWAREVGAMLQLLPLLTVPVVAVIQTCRYISAGPPDIFERIQMLYRPPVDHDGSLHDLSTQTEPTNADSATGGANGAGQDNAAVEDPPPKYTPPPSYTTATGARIAKMLRQSFRRSVRRIQLAVGTVGAAAAGGLPRGLPEAWATVEQRRPAALPPPAPDPAPSPAPPDYAAVLVEISQASLQDVTIVVDDHAQDAVDDAEPGPAPAPATAAPSPAPVPPSNLDPNAAASEFQRPSPPPRAARGHQHHRTLSSQMTAADVASVLRCSVRRAASASAAGRSQSMRHAMRQPRARVHPTESAGEPQLWSRSAEAEAHEGNNPNVAAPALHAPETSTSKGLQCISATAPETPSTREGCSVVEARTELQDDEGSMV